MNEVTVRVLEDAGAIGVGCVLLLTCAIIEPVMAFLFFICACGALIIGIFDFGCLLKVLSKQQKLRSLKDDTKGLAWIWIVGLGFTIPMCALVYWVLDYPFDIIANVAMGAYTFTGTMASAWDLSRLLISYMLAFCIIYAVLWVIVNSKNPGGYGF